MTWVQLHSLAFGIQLPQHHLFERQWLPQLIVLAPLSKSIAHKCKGLFMDSRLFLMLPIAANLALSAPVNWLPVCLPVKTLHKCLECPLGANGPIDSYFSKVAFCILQTTSFSAFSSPSPMWLKYMSFQVISCLKAFNGSLYPVR